MAAITNGVFVQPGICDSFAIVRSHPFANVVAPGRRGFANIAASQSALLVSSLAAEGNKTAAPDRARRCRIARGRNNETVTAIRAQLLNVPELSLQRSQPALAATDHESLSALERASLKGGNMRKTIILLAASAALICGATSAMARGGGFGGGGHIGGLGGHIGGLGGHVGMGHMGGLGHMGIGHIGGPVGIDHVGGLSDHLGEGHGLAGLHLDRHAGHTGSIGEERIAHHHRGWLNEGALDADASCYPYDMDHVWRVRRDPLCD
jgi:hypothetical protein